MNQFMLLEHAENNIGSRLEDADLYDEDEVEAHEDIAYHEDAYDEDGNDVSEALDDQFEGYQEDNKEEAERNGDDIDDGDLRGNIIPFNAIKVFSYVEKVSNYIHKLTE